MPQMISVTAIAEAFPEGCKTTAVVIEYDCEIDLPGNPTEWFAVSDRSLEPKIPAADRKIIRAYSNPCPSRAGAGQPGRYVILETDLSQKEAYAILPYGSDGEPDPFGPGPMCYPGPDTQKPPKGGGPSPRMDYCGPKPLRLTVSQKRPIPTAAGGAVPPSDAQCTRAVYPDAARFRLYQYKGIPYNLYIPEGYDPGERYPLVLFIPDAGSRGKDVRAPMLQGTGGAVWARPEEQAKRPCFVVCPAFGPEDVLTRDDFTCLPKLYEVKGMLDEITAAFPIDPDRVYATGQSMGCMSICELMCTHPGYFAGAILVAGQWDPARCGPAMAHQNLWILVSENDRKAHPGMDAVTAAIEENGGRVARFQWDGGADEAALNSLAAQALSEPANVRYTLFAGDSVVPPGEEANPGSNHVNTWRVAYQIPALRDWLFTVRREHTPGTMGGETR